MEVFSGCVRYEEVMNVVLRGFYAQDGKTTLRSEQSLYTGITIKHNNNNITHLYYNALFNKSFTQTKVFYKFI